MTCIPMRCWGIRTQATGAALAVVLAVVTFAAPGPVGAAVQPGRVQCVDLTGQLKFHPPLTLGGSAPELATLTLALAGCTGSGGAATPDSGHGSAAVSLTSSNCTTLVTKSVTPISLALRWSPHSAQTTAIRFPGFAPLKTGTPGLRLGGSGTTASGSYTGTDNGASSNVRVLWSLSTAQIAAACGARTGLKTLPIQGGTISLK